MSLTMERASDRTRNVEISDTFEAATYVTQGHQVLRITGYGARKRFVFEALPEDLIQAFETDALLVSPTRLKAAYKFLLTRLHQELDQQTRIPTR